MKEDLIKFKEELEKAKGLERKYCVVSLSDIPYLFPVTHSNDEIRERYDSVNKFVDSLTTTVTLPPKYNNPVKIDSQCEELMKQAIKFFVDNNLPLNGISLISKPYALVDANIIIKLKQEREEIYKMPKYSTYQFEHIKSFFEYARKLISSYMSFTYVYVNFNISKITGLWYVNERIELCRLHDLDTPYNYVGIKEIREEFEKIKSLSVSGIIDLEEFTNTMEENGYKVEIFKHSKPEIKQYINLLNGNNGNLSVTANLQFKGNKRTL